MDKLEKANVLKSTYIVCLKELELAKTNILMCTKQVQNHFYSYSNNNTLHNNLPVTNKFGNLITYEENIQKNQQSDSTGFFDQEYYNPIYKYNHESIKNELEEIHSINEQKNENIQKKKLLKKNCKILQNQILSTSNSLKAVLGYIPRDDKKICRFYDAKSGSCFKGSRCKLEHIEKLSDGWTRDEDETTIDVKNKLVYPLRGNIVKIFPTNVIDSKSFYAQFHDSESESRSDIEKLILEMNSKKEKLQFFELDSSPVLLQLVIAMHNNSDIWYRAKIVEILDDFTYKVFFVDFGDTDIVNIQQIRKWDSRYKYLPLQAVKFEIVDIENNSSRSFGMELLKNMILGRILKAEILDISNDDVLIQLYDENDCNVGKKLASMNYANEKKTKFICQEQLLPG